MNSAGEGSSPEMHSASNALEVAILEASAEGIAGATLEGVLNVWNPAACRIFGYTENEILGKNCALLFPEKQKWEDILHKVKEGETVMGQELEGRCKEGKIIDV